MPNFCAVVGRSLPLVAMVITTVACSSDADGVFGESATGPGATSGVEGGSGEGGSTGSSPSGTGSTTSSGTATVTSSTGDGGAATATSSTGDGGAATATSSTGDGGAATATSTAAGPSCGDAAQNGDEDCDAADLDGATCASIGFPGGGTLACSGSCTFDPSGCNRCGNGEVNNGEDCDDGSNAPDDGCDAQCHFEGLSCAQPIDLVIDRGDLVSIATTNAAGPAAPDTCLDATGPGRILRVLPESDGFLTAWIRRDGTSFDSSLRMGYGCNPNDAFVCADSYDPGSAQQPGGGETGSVFAFEGQPVWVFVEAFAPGDVGDFVVELTLSRGDCDEPVVLPVEPGSGEGIVAWGFNENQGNDEVGTCGGNGEDVTYRLRGVGSASPVDVAISPVEGFLYNPVLHAREGLCTEQLAETECSAQSGFGQTEQISDLTLAVATYIHADAAQNSTGGWLMRVTPQQP